MLLNLNIRIANVLKIKEAQVKNTIQLLDNGATVPFIARYRKEVTGGLSDLQLREFVEKLSYMRELDDRRSVILKSIDEQGKLTPELEQLIFVADNKTILEDLYLPYKPKRRTKASVAREAGLEPLALDILNNQDLHPDDQAKKYINIQLNINDSKAALDGARYILMEIFGEDAVSLAKIREKLINEAMVTTSVIKDKEEIGHKFTDYFNYNEPLKSIPSHRALAILRGNKEGVLSVCLSCVEQNKNSHNNNTCDSYEEIIVNNWQIHKNKKASSWLLDTVHVSFKNKIFPSLENELLNQMRENSCMEAIKVFSTNLHNLLLTAPAGTKTTMGLDPGIRTGVKIAVVNQTGQLLETSIIYPFQPRNLYKESIQILLQLIEKYQVELISIGNGTASRETEKLVADLLITHPEVKTTKAVVSEAGASVYSASQIASTEFPDLDVSLRGAVSIARRLQDPLAELVKIDPKSIGVGQYQHDVNQTKLSHALTNTVEGCVNQVGVNVNSASVSLLAYVAGLNNNIAINIVNYRNQNGPFVNRQQLKKVPRLGEKVFEQCAGFLRIQNGENVLDSSGVHPESYQLVELIASKLNTSIEDLMNNSALLKSVNLADLTNNIYGLPTIKDTLMELEKPGLDPRGEFKTAQFKDGVNSIDDLYIGMELEGVITNVTDFGAFIDIGVHQDGLIHISEIADQFVNKPSNILKNGQIVKARIIQLDKKRKRISLSLKKPNQSTPFIDNIITKKPKTNKNSNHNNNVNTIETTLSNAFARLKKN